MTTQAPPPLPHVAKRIDAFESVFQVAQLAVRRTLKGARATICAVTILLPLAISLLVRGHGAGEKQQAQYFFNMLGVYHFGIAVPLTALLFATSFPWPEAEEGTLTYWFTSPVRRWTVLLGRYLASVVVAEVLLCVGVLAIGLPLRTTAESGVSSVMVSAVTSTLLVVPAYLALFQLASTLTRFGLTLGFIFILIENVVSVIPGAFQRVTLVFYVRSQLFASIPEKARQFGGVLRVTDPAENWVALTVFGCVTLVALGLSLLLVESIEYRGRTSQQG